MRSSSGPHADDDDEDEDADAEAVYFASLGLPDYDNPISRPTPYDSRVGGAAVWFGGASGEGRSGRGSGGGGGREEARRPLACVSCGVRLFLVAQIYAPVAYARALAVFGCNQPDCSRQSSTWRVVRTQDTRDVDPWKLVPQDGGKGGEDSSATAAAAATLGTTIKPDSAKEQPQTSSQQHGRILETEAMRVVAPESFGLCDGVSGNGNDGGEGDDSGWGDGGLFGEDDDAFGFGGNISANGGGGAELEELLRLRDLSRQQSSIGKKGKAHAKAPANVLLNVPPKASGDLAALAAPSTAKAVAASPLSPTQPTAAAADDDDAAAAAAVAVATSATTLATSLTENASSASPRCFRSHYLYNINEPSAAHVAYDSVATSVEKAMKLHGKSANLGGAQTEGMNAVDKYEAAPAEEIALHRYQERVLRAPSQCVRYAYGGTPLWPSAKGLPRVPNCPGCGGNRVFEMQLMSPVLHVLDVDNHLSEAGAGVTTGEKVASATIAMRAEASEDGDGGKGNGGEEGPWQTVASRNVGGGSGGGSGVKPTPKNAKNAKKRSKKRKQARKKAEARDSSVSLSSASAGSCGSSSSYSSLATIQLAGGGGMDFATVLVYSCENSCEQSREEFAVVHEPL